jgi:membrane protein YdbS with pleckstrin-like domain
MQKNLSQLYESSQYIQVHPRLANERRVVRLKRVTFLVSLLLFITLMTSFFVFGSVFRSNSFFWILIGIFMFVVTSVLGISAHGVVNLTRQLSALERLEARRQAVLQGEQRLFPAEQLSPDASALPLPFTLQQSARKTRLFGSLVMLLLPIGLILWGWQRYQASFPTPDLTSFQLIASGGVFVIVMIIDLFRHYRAWREQIVLTEEGLVASSMWSSRRLIPWREARLFALDGCIVRGRKSFTLLFELSSASEVICWEWMIHIHTDMPPQANQPFFLQGFDFQLEAIISLIAGRTKLPLHDLQEYKVRKPH